jgi:TfoX/Sxy family transcriptional regulator of competence genes
MAYDEELAHRIREQLAQEHGITEKAMFGGLAFLLNGNMAVSASGQGGLMVRVDPEDSEQVLARPHASMFEMRGRQMAGWIRVAPQGVRTKAQLAWWVRRGVQFARTLPAKR